VLWRIIPDHSASNAHLPISVPYDKVINSFPKSERHNALPVHGAVVGWPDRWLCINSEPRLLLEREQIWAAPSNGHTSDMYVLIGAKIDAGKYL
jgi:hypothetical protein